MQRLMSLDYKNKKNNEIIQVEEPKQEQKIKKEIIS